MNLVVIGASTGGPKTLDEIFSKLPVLNAAVVIIQHMPPGFDAGFAECLGRKTGMAVELAKNDGLLDAGRVFIAPAGLHLRLAHNSRFQLNEGEKVNFACPSIDVAMESLRKHPSGNLMGVVLTGMGADGASGIAHVKGIGGITIAQDEKTSVIYGMPRCAAETGKVDFVLPVEEIGKRMLELLGRLA